MLEHAFWAKRNTSNERSAVIRSVMVVASYTHKGVPNCWANVTSVEGIKDFMYWIMRNLIHPFNASSFNKLFNIDIVKT